MVSALSITSTSFAQIPDANGVVHGCYSVGTTKALFLVDSPPNYACPVGLSEVSLLSAGPNGAGCIQNTMTPQAGANFNIGGNGTIGGNLSISGPVNTTAGYNIAGVPVLQSSTKSADIAAGPGAGGPAGGRTALGGESLRT